MIVDNIEIVIPSGSLGIIASGGADSSLLLYLLMSNTTEKIHVFTLASDEKSRMSALISSQVIEKCVQLTGNSNLEHHVRYVKFQTNDVLLEVPKQYLKQGIVSGVFAGVTANPPVDIANSFSGIEENTQQSARDPLICRPTEKDYFYTPFTNINKQKIAEMYSLTGLVETLFPLTRSCEIEYRTDFAGHCNQCWWCKEREWGFRRFL